MNRVSELLGDAAKLAKIAPPKGSYADVFRFLEECRAEGVASIEVDAKGEAKGFATPFGLALLRLYRWAKESENRGIPYEEAVTAFNAAIERTEGAEKALVREQEQRAARAMREREGLRRNDKKRRGNAADGYQPESDDLLSYAESKGL